MMSGAKANHLLARACGLALRLAQQGAVPLGAGTGRELGEHARERGPGIMAWDGCLVTGRWSRARTSHACRGCCVGAPGNSDAKAPFSHSGV